MRLVQISDTHVLCSGGATTRDTEQMIGFVNDVLRPDVVVHTGDVVGIDPDDEGDRSAAVALLAALRAPLFVVPGNHDVGAPGDDPWMGLAITSDRVARHNEVFGEAPFLEHHGGWGLIGLHSELFGSGLPEEDAQWEWIERTLSAPAGPPLLAFMHRPLWNHRPALAADGNSVSSALRARLLGLPGAGRLRAVGNGHLHWFQRRQRSELLEVWGPATGFLGPTYDDTTAFTQCGVVEWELRTDSADARFRAPPTLDERQPGDVPEIADRIRSVDSRRRAAVRGAHQLDPRDASPRGRSGMRWAYPPT